MHDVNRNNVFNPPLLTQAIPLTASGNPSMKLIQMPNIEGKATPDPTMKSDYLNTSLS